MNLKTAERLATLRKENGYSQDQLAERLGLSRQAVSKWERGEANPDTDNLIALAKLYHISLDELLLTDDGHSKETDKESIKEDNRTTLLFKAISGVIGGLILIVYFLLGTFIENGFEVYWVLLLLIPVIPSIFDAIGKRKFTAFLYPLLVVALYCYPGMQFGLWHPGWVLFITIPVYYLCFEPIDRYIQSARD